MNELAEAYRPDWWGTLDHFEAREFDCPCCGRNEMEEEFVRKLDFLRGECGFALRINSGYRCPEHNGKVSSTGRTGPHTTGRASDVSVFGERAFTVLAMAPGLFTGIGVKQHGAHESRFVHLDDLEKKDSRFRPTVWTY